MNPHQTSCDHDWFHVRYHGEDRDDGTSNELSIKPAVDEDRLNILLTNVGFDQHCYDNTFSLTREDAKQLAGFLKEWLNRSK